MLYSLHLARLLIFRLVVAFQVECLDQGLEEVLQQVMFDVPSRDDVARVVITAQAVLENVNPTIVPRESVEEKKTPREKSA